jgi:hypothetical protein
MTTHTFKIEIPTDENGFIGRECLECKKYFKLKPGTGLPTQHCHCPYCDYEGDSNTFWTQDQIEYAQSKGPEIAYNKVIEPLLDDFTKSIMKLDKSTKGGFLQIKITPKIVKPFFPIKFYSELELETLLTCDNCKLEFAIYGVFGRCPDCNELNAFTIFKKSLEVSRKHLMLFQQFQNDVDITQANLKFILGNVISAFDGLGKELRQQYPSKYPERPRNLFQNIDELVKVISLNYSVDLSNEVNDFEFIRLMFQVRHIFEHNMGVVDVDFIKKIPTLNHLLGRKYNLTETEVEEFIFVMEELGSVIENVTKKDGTS